MKQVHILVVAKTKFGLYEAMSRMSFGMWVDVKGRVISTLEEAHVCIGLHFDAVMHVDNPSDEVRAYLATLIYRPGMPH